MKQLDSVYKFELSIGGSTNKRTIDLPENAIVLTAGNQREKLVVWVQGNFASAEAKVARDFYLFGTGHAEIDPEDPMLFYIGTVMFSDGAVVLHVYEKFPS